MTKNPPVLPPLDTQRTGDFEFDVQTVAMFLAHALASALHVRLRELGDLPDEPPYDRRLETMAHAAALRFLADQTLGMIASAHDGENYRQAVERVVKAMKGKSTVEGMDS